MSARGSTLIELMIVVSMLGILALAWSGAVVMEEKSASLLLDTERAMQVLEYEASTLMVRMPSDPEVQQRLLSRVPAGEFSEEQQGAYTVLTVRWQSHNGAVRSRSLTVMGGRP